MRRFPWFIAVVLLASCSQENAPPKGTPPVVPSSASAPVAKPTPTTAASTAPAGSTAPLGTSIAALPIAKPAASVVAPLPPSGPPVSQVVVHYDSTSPDSLIVNGDLMELAELDQKLPGEFRRLEALQTGTAPIPHSTLRIEVDAATPASFVRRLQDVLESAGARRAQLVVEGFVPPGGADPETHPLRIALPHTFSDQPSKGPANSHIELLVFRAQSGADGKLASLRLDEFPPFSDSIAGLNKHASIKVMASRAADQEDPTITILSDDALRADELAAVIFACEYRLDLEGRLAPLVRDVCLALPKLQVKTAQ